MRLSIGLRCCAGCRGEHFEAGAWKHKGCVVANKPAVVANTEAPVVANSRHGKYRDLDARRAYMRAYMARRRAEQRAA